MQPQSVMREVYLPQNLLEISRLTVNQHAQDTLIKEVHNEPKYAKTDLKPFLTILGTNQRAQATISIAFSH